MLKLVALVFICLLQRNLSAFSIVRRHIESSHLNEISTGKSSNTSESASSSSVIENRTSTSPNKATQKVTVLLATILIGIAIRSELFAIADGTHLFFPEAESDAVERQHRNIAIASVEMWTKLHTMECVDDILSNVTITVLMNLDKLKNVQNMEDILKQIAVNVRLQREIVQFLFEQIEFAFRAVPAVYEEYSAEKRKTESQILPPIGKAIYVLGGNESTVDAKRVNQFLASYPAKRFMFANRVFLWYLTANVTEFNRKNDFNRSVLARSIVELSSQPGKREVLQAIYQQALNEATRRSDIADNCTVEESMVLYGENLLGVLPELIEKQIGLSTELEAIKEKIFASNMKQYQAIRKRSSKEFRLNCTKEVPQIEKPLHRYLVLLY